MQKDWQILEPKTKEILRLTDALGISSLLAHLLINRKIESPEEAERLLNPQLSDLFDPFLFKDIGKAVARIKKTIENKEKILIYGDYDADGITGMAILIRTLKNLGAKLYFYIPHRIEEGYGMSGQGVRFAVENKINLVITVDCGVTDCLEIESLAQKGIDTIVTDHHEPDLNSLPSAAYCIINPLYPNETYPGKNLSGAGVAFKLCQAISGNPAGSDEMLELSALGTIADVSKLRGENRILVKYGLARIKETKLAGIKALIEASGINKRIILTTDVSFILGPRINAMGRLDSAEIALKLFLTDSFSEALDIAKTLNSMNKKRQEIEMEILNEALMRIEREMNFKNEHAIVLSDPNWHQGVLGIVASKLTERYLRPVILFSLKDGIAAGSGRVKLENIHLFKLLDKCRNLVCSYGGHKSACGIKMQEELIPEFKSRLNETIKENIDKNTFIPVTYIDAELDFASITENLVKEFDILAPFGEGNPMPVFISRNLKLKNYPGNGRNKDKNNFAAWVTNGTRTYQAKGKDFLSWSSMIGQDAEFDLVYNLQLSTCRTGEAYICLRVEDFNPSVEIPGL